MAKKSSPFVSASRFRSLAALLGVFSALLPISAAASALEIGAVEASGSELVVTVVAPGVVVGGGGGGGASFEVLYLDRDGVLLEAQAAFLPAGSSGLGVSINGHFSGLGARGLQHRVELIGASGAPEHVVDLRLGFVCDDSGVCRVEARAGLFVEGAFALSAELAEQVGGSEPIDLAKLSRRQPSLLGSILETAIDLGDLLDADEPCQCFYSVDPIGYGHASRATIATKTNGSQEEPLLWFEYAEIQHHLDAQRFAVGHDTQMAFEVDFHCFKVLSIQELVYRFEDGVLTVNLPNLGPCAAECAAPVEWTIEQLDFETELLANGGGASIDSTVILDVDGAGVSSTAAFSVTGGVVSPAVPPSGQQAALGYVASQTPSRGVFRAETRSEVRDFSMVATPRAEIRQKGILKARGLATCGRETLFSDASMSLWGNGHATISVVLGPGYP